MNPESKEIVRLAGELTRGEVVAFPTETFYGLAVNPFVEGALPRLFALKQRPSEKPVLVLIDDLVRLGELVREVPTLYEVLMAKFWPGPLTLIFQGRPGLPELLTDGRGTIGIRLSSQPLACRLAAAAGGVITGTSANPGGAPAAKTADAVRDFFPTGLAGIVDGGQAPGGHGSTIVAEEGGRLRLVRSGAIPFSEILAVVATEA
ncbi:MAG TPA: L-threonylcarbamoyladenylate synthase [Desulfurivibrionaceae bacterium]|nr:L-threonylcarbamoyladenylate synthase [Desulfurivibrionaceae bacterium]